jgi:hypothetical protein
VNSIRVLTLSLEPGPFLNKYSITGLEGENDRIQEVDKTRQELSLSRKKKYNPIKSFVFGDADGIDRAFFLFRKRLNRSFCYREIRKKRLGRLVFLKISCREGGCFSALF